MFRKQSQRLLLTLGVCLTGLLPASAAPVYWVDWTQGTTGANGSAAGVMNINGTTVDVTYSGEVYFIQTNGGTNYWNPSTPYTGSLVDNAPPTPDIIALSQASSKTLTFSKPVTNLFFSVVSLNGNGYRFNQDFEVVSYGAGYYGNGTLTKEDLGNGQYQLNGTGEPHGVIRFTGAVSSITWTSLTNETWNGFTVGTNGLAEEPSTAAPEPGSLALLLPAFGAVGLVLRRRRS